jgi:hypothetical protein
MNALDNANVPIQTVGELLQWNIEDLQAFNAHLPLNLVDLISLRELTL